MINAPTVATDQDDIKIIEGQPYKVTSETVMLRNKPMTINHFTPILSDEERAKRKQEISQKLYDVFSKYI